MSEHDCEPCSKADTLAERLVDNGELQLTLLDETLSAQRTYGELREAGRTVCVIDDLGDKETLLHLDRYTDAVDLQKCSEEARLTGIYHTHTTPTQLRTPSHSLPDYANVIYGLADVSVVVGTESLSVVTAPSSDTADTVRDEFENVLGIRVDSPQDVVDAINSGRLADPAAARQRVREALGELVVDVSPGFDETAIESALPPIPSTLGGSTTSHSECAHLEGCYVHGSAVDDHDRDRDRDRDRDHDHDADRNANGAATQTGYFVTRTARPSYRLRDQGRLGGAVLVNRLKKYDVGDIIIGTMVGDLASSGIRHVLRP